MIPPYGSPEAESSGHTFAGPEFPVHYHDIGDGPALVMIQAFGIQPGSSAWMTYHAIVGELAGSHRCILVDLPNYGLTGPATFEEPVHDMYARTVLAVMDHLGIDSATVVGHSIGGTTGLVLALRHTERVKRLVVGSCHASTGGDPYVLSPFPSELLKLTIEANRSAADADRFRRQLSALWYDQALVTDELVNWLLDQRELHPDHHAAALASTSIESSHIAELRELRLPMLVIHGRFDRMVPLEQALMLTSYVPQADLVVLNRCGHWPPFERPREYVSHLQAYLAQPVG